MEPPSNPTHLMVSRPPERGSLSGGSPQLIVTETVPPSWRLRKHAHYQQAYKLSRKQQSATMTYFVAVRPALMVWPVARVGLTAGKVLGNAVARNRIKRRMREAVRASLHSLPAQVDVILHPRRAVLTIEFALLKQEVERTFKAIAGRMSPGNSDNGARRDLDTPAASGSGSDAATRSVARPTGGRP